MSIFTQDSFTDTAGAALEDHVGEIGAAWASNPDFTGGAVITDANRVRSDGNSSVAVYYASGVPSSADYDVEADLYVASDGNPVGIFGRLSTTQTTHHLFDFEGAAFNLYTVVNGSTVGAVAYPATLNAGQTYHLRLSMRGNQLTCYVDGVAILSATDDNVSDAGRAGMFFAGGAFASDTVGYHLDNFVASTPQSVAVTDANLFFSPYNWFSDGDGSMQSSSVRADSTYAQTNSPGAYLKFTINAVDAGFATLLLDTSPLSGVTADNCPTLAISIDGQAFSQPLLAYASDITRLSLADQWSVGDHTVLVYFQSVALDSSDAMGDRWNTPQSVVKVTGVELDGKGSATTGQTLAPKRLLVFGDSITEAADAVGEANLNADQDATQSYAQLLALGLDTEVGIVAFSGQGWSVAGYGNVPAFYDTATPSDSAFDHYFSGASRLDAGALTPPPDYVFVLQGHNDVSQSATDEAVTDAVSGWLATVRSEAPRSLIYILLPWDGSKHDAIVAGAAAIGGATRIDLAPQLGAAIASGGVDTNDGLHPSARGHAILAAVVLSHVAAGDGGSSIQLSDGFFAT